MFNPVSTYRIQFHKGFNFDDFEKIIPYLERLRVKTIYASPIFNATPGSMHGYDVVDPLTINPEIGTIDQLVDISKTLHKKGIGWIQDIVPNHMAFNSGNSWLMDVLEKGELSAYRSFFDQSLSDDLFECPIMVPFLGSPLSEVIQNNELTIAYENGSLSFSYADQSWPLKIESYRAMIMADSKEIRRQFDGLASDIIQLKDISDADKFASAVKSVKAELIKLYRKKENKQVIDKNISRINADKKLLLDIANSQNYRLCSFQETDQKINYRRFFTVNSLICLNIHREEVFTAYHQLIKTLVQDGIFQGLRVDHIDGLYDPTKYLEDLRKLAGDNTYIIAEKILEEGEELISTWPIQGTTGYDFLSFANNLFTNEAAEDQFRAFYKKLTCTDESVSELVSQKKQYILSEQMGGELDNLTALFFALDFISGKKKESLSRADIKSAIAAFIVNMPVYRYYGNKLPFSNQETADLRKVFEIIKNENQVSAKVIKALEDAMLNVPKSKSQQGQLLHFYQRCMQFTGPVMAKGVEDTLMYSYNSFVDHNEVGDTPQTFGIKSKDFHAAMKDRQKKWPLALNSTSTHDTKRGEDVRARLNALSDMPDEWFEKVNEWTGLNKKFKTGNIPDANDEYLIYQTFTGAYPMPGDDEDNFGERLKGYLEKALREAKVHTNWTDQDEEYEAGTLKFAGALLDKKSAFWKSFAIFHKKIARVGVINSMAQVLLKFTSPGVPDVYQGCESWDLSLVDPDNRRPVNYSQRTKWLDELTNGEFENEKLWQNIFDGSIKLRLLNELLQLRQSDPQTFEKGKYIPLKIEGIYKKQLLAFARNYREAYYIIVIPLNIGTVCEAQQKELLNLDWGDTRIILPDGISGDLEDIFTKTKIKAISELSANNLLKQIPLALLKLLYKKNKRGAGVLAHITSLPAKFGVGDFGPGAKAFADLLHKGHQKYWQLLPLSPVEKANQYSPYSSWSAMGGNTMLISPNLLVDEGLLTIEETIRYNEPVNASADLESASWLKNILFTKAWSNFKNGKHLLLRIQFKDFAEKEVGWLQDFALYETLKAKFNGKAWYEWPLPYKTKQQQAMSKFEKENEDAVEQSKWLQFIFYKQWKQLKTYCNHLNIKIIGDLPFYISYDAVDVWANPEIFSLNAAGEPDFVAGVPPDYFNADGQLWGMPVFNWKKLRETDYDWWLKRIEKNIELFNLIRLDHFRAFSSYWSVPAGETTAINGKWEQGPGDDIFQVFMKKFGDLPFIAEDLGNIDEAVYQLRDQFNLPGMKVIQFAFGNDLSKSPHIPHNYTENDIAYSGTHDNNTCVGWYVNDADAQACRQVQSYTGFKVNKTNIHERLIDMVMSSTAKIVIVPLQDLLGLDESARMNVPAATDKNWLWRLTTIDWENIPVKRLKHQAKTYNRI